jgi:hypothetical protein
MEMDDQAGLRMSDPADPRVALQVTCSDSDSPLDETSERLRNGLPKDARCDPGHCRGAEWTRTVEQALAVHL